MLYTNEPISVIDEEAVKSMRCSSGSLTHGGLIEDFEFLCQ
jgi:hypothetical protein